MSILKILVILSACNLQAFNMHVHYTMYQLSDGHQDSDKKDFVFVSTHFLAHNALNLKTKEYFFLSVLQDVLKVDGELSST